MSKKYSEPNVKSFVVKIWVEENLDHAKELPWRGYITEVVSGERRYVKSLDEITNYFNHNLSSMIETKPNNKSITD